MKYLKHGEVLELLDKYNQFLHKHGYFGDEDWWCEKPTALEEFVKTLKLSDDGKITQIINND